MEPDSKLPPRILPLLYFGFGTISFGLALVGMVVYAQDFTEFYYHPRILAFTHLVTLGWITGNILGSLYIVGPMALQVWMPSGVKDKLIFVFFAGAVSGMVWSFWIIGYLGLAYSTIIVYLSILSFAIIFLSRLRIAKAPRFVQFHVALAFVNFLVAALWGTLISLNKIFGFLSTSVTANIYAHSHLAAIGWALLMVFGIGYRLIPMFLPGKPIAGKWPWISGIATQAGVTGLFVVFLVRPVLSIFFGVLTCIGILLYFGNVLYTIKHRKPTPPPSPPRPDFAMVHVLFAFLSLLVAAAFGLTLTQLPATEKTLRLALAYGATGLIGFLGQMVIAMRPKILSVFTWYHVFTVNQSIQGLPRPIDMPMRIFSGFTAGLWVVGVPLLTTGILRASRLMITAAACLLLAGLFLSLLNEIWILRLMFREKQ